ncbi:hypothetical protein AFCA_013340 [Aspergillus flavus]|nr:hypothetical protein AFCA_013340 [Aspergillus flavus]GMF70830.1 unnamed protein product [Aspergillus oryzae]GMF86625.1 unnamed protein product [Aspergillus oryzae]
MSEYWKQKQSGTDQSSQPQSQKVAVSRGSHPGSETQSALLILFPSDSHFPSSEAPLAQSLIAKSDMSSNSDITLLITTETRAIRFPSMPNIRFLGYREGFLPIEVAPTEIPLRGRYSAG